MQGAARAGAQVCPYSPAPEKGMYFLKNSC